MDVLKNYPWGIGLAAGGTALTAIYFGKGVMQMEGQHWIMLLVILVVGYTLGRIWTTPARMIGLP
jgi:hypothetical protein